MVEVKKISGEGGLHKCSLEGFNFQVDPYIGCEHLCSYCYGLNQAISDWEKQILSYGDIIGELSGKLAVFPPQTIYMGMNCDPYQPAEKHFQMTRDILILLGGSGFSVSILTKSPLILRDLDVLSRMEGASVGTSIAFSTEETRKKFEKNSPPITERLEMLASMKKAGIKTYTLICPVFPFITDTLQLIEKAAPCSDTIWVYPLQIQGEETSNWQNINQILENHFPGIRAEFEEIVLSRGHPYWQILKEELTEIRDKRNLDLQIKL